MDPDTGSNNQYIIENKTDVDEHGNDYGEKTESVNEVGDKRTEAAVDSPILVDLPVVLPHNNDCVDKKIKGDIKVVEEVMEFWVDCENSSKDKWTSRGEVRKVIAKNGWISWQDWAELWKKKDNQGEKEKSSERTSGNDKEANNKRKRND